MKIGWWLLYLVILSLPLGQIGKVSFGQISLYLHDFIAAALACWFLIYAFWRKGKGTLPKLFLPAVAFLIISLISSINSYRWLAASEWVVSAMYWVRWLLYFSVYFSASTLFAALTETESVKMKGRAVSLLVLSSLILAFVGFLQLKFLPDFSALDPSLGWDPHKNRLAATFLDPNFAGAYLVLGALVVIKDALSMKLKGVMNFLVLVFAIFLTFSRSAWGMFAVSVFIYGLGIIVTSKRTILRKVALSSSLGIVVLFILLGAYRFVPSVQTRIAGLTDPADSARFRIISWKNALVIAKDNLLLGVGFNSYRFAQERYGFFEAKLPLGGHSGAGADSSLLLVLATTGVFGLISYSLLLLDSFLHSLAGSAEKISLAFFAVTLALILESNFINSLFYPPILIFWWVWAAIAVA